MPSKIIYDKSLLEEIIRNSKAVLIETYEKLTRNTIINFKCKCGIESTKTFRSINNIGAFCKSCTSLIQKEKQQKTNLERYGVAHVLQSKEKKEKAKQTLMERYGIEHAFHLDKFKEKAKQTIIERFGVENVSQSQEVRAKVKAINLKKYGVEYTMMNKDIKEKAIQTMLDRYDVKIPIQSPIIKEKIKQTILERYGVEHISQTQQYKEKYKKTCLERYGVEHNSQSEQFKEKFKKTCLEKYGVEHISQTVEYKEKYRETCLERYGVEYPSQCQEIQEKTQKNAKKYKEYKMPSGAIRKVQGYEPFALDELIKTIKEDDIKTDRKDVPRIKYKSQEKQRYYFPDIYIPSENRIIEVKSTWTYQSKTDNVKEKEEATKTAGYTYEIWIYDKKGNKHPPRTP